MLKYPIELSPTAYLEYQQVPLSRVSERYKHQAEWNFETADELAVLGDAQEPHGAHDAVWRGHGIHHAKNDAKLG